MGLDLVHTDIYENDELKHHGILGMHWGIRRFQNEDGSLTEEGRLRYGVKTAAETKKLSYSKDYMSLKAKKNRTPKEEEKLRRLEEGKKHFEKAYKDPDYWNKKEDNAKNAEKLEYESMCYQEYLNSTNYGKGMKTAEILMAVPTTVIGGAIDAGAIYAQAKLGSPIAFYGLTTGLGIASGTALGASIYENKHMEQLQNELNNSNKSKSSNNESVSKKPIVTISDSQAKKNGYESAKDFGIRFHFEVVDKDILPSEKETLKAFGLKANDLAMDHDGYVVRKDGKPFTFTYQGKTYEREYLEDASADHMWGMTPKKNK